MGFEISGTSDSTHTVPSLTSAADVASGAPPVSTGDAPLAGDAITTSPLTYFGHVVQQIGQAMVNGEHACAGDQRAGLEEAIGLLEGVVGLMSAYPEDESRHTI